MAYGHTNTYYPINVGGRRGVLVNIAETEAGAATEWDVALGAYIPSGIFRIVRLTGVKTAGSAATIAPVFGTATNPTSGTSDYIGAIGAAASQDSTNSGPGWVGYGLTLYGRTIPNAGADNSVTIRLYILEGWQ